MNIPTSSSARVRCGDEFNLAIFFSFNCLRYAHALAISRAGHWAFGYDLLLRVIWLGREGAFRKNVVDLAGLKPGESVLDVGCGTGTLAITAKQRVGPKGRVCGIDASPEMIKKACKKTRKAGVDIVFENAAVDKLPFADATFDSVLSTVMLHHLPDESRRECISEIRRVLKPGGRLLAVDFGGPADEKAQPDRALPSPY